ncbi:hypothetical protein MIMGU_mgv1a023264mg, partial [Erythranthe guttata]
MFQPKELYKDDRISQLPDDILVDNILSSFLSVEEAARTSVLSSRWINLWKYTPRLKLDGDERLATLRRQCMSHRKLIETEERNYVRRVNRVLQSHKALTLKEFRIRFALIITDHASLTRWLEFAFARRVESLEFDLLDSHYRFPEKLVSASLVDFKSLRSLIFRNVHVSNGPIEFFLRNCPLLEKLIVCYSSELSNLRVCGSSSSSLALKHLEIVRCNGIKSIVVSAPSLTFFKAATYDRLLLEHIPMLVEVDVNRTDDDVSLRVLLSELSCCSQLERLRLTLLSEVRHTYTSREQNEVLSKLPQLRKLKTLVVTYILQGSESLTRLADLISASPCLEEFVLECEWGFFRKKDSQVKDAPINRHHHHLKVVKFRGYRGGQIRDLEFIEYILENCLVLEKLIIEPSASKNNTIEMEQTARANTKHQLESR